MKQLAKKLIQPLVRGIGYDIVRYKEEDFASQKKQRGIDPFADIQHYLNDTDLSRYVLSAKSLCEK